MNDLIEQYERVRGYTEAMCEPLEIEDYTPQSAVFASPPKWHLAHTTWFFEEMILKQNAPSYQLFDDSFSFLFNSYYNSVGQRLGRAERGLITRPSVETVFAYRKHVDAAMVELLSSELKDEVKELVILGLNHEEQHQELLVMDLKYTFSRNPIYPKYTGIAWVDNLNETEGWYSVEEGVYEVGHDGHGFSFDNEEGRHKVYLETFEINKALVTNGEFIEFIEKGGYSDPLLWLDEGWAWVNETDAKHPLYWHNVDGEWFHYTLGGLQKVNTNAVLSHVSFYEASAFAAFKGMRLPTEFEWEVASQNFDWGLRWEWTNSAYLPYPRFAIKEGAVGEYNGKFMINQMVLRGGSVATSEGHSRHTYRNFFHPQMQWQFSGIRLVKM